ncbi:MAG: response regulator [Bacteroidales bacterium]
MNNLDQQQIPPDEKNNSQPNTFSPSKESSFSILSFNDVNENDLNVPAYLLGAISQPVLFWAINEKKIFYNLAFEELCSRIGYENTTTEQIIGRLWEIENIQAAVNDLLNNCNYNEIKKINRTVKLGKQHKANYWLYACITNSHQQLAWLVFDNVDIETEKYSPEKRIDSSSQTIEIFFSNLSHEIRTPLNAILGFAELLRITDLPEEQRIQYLDIIRNKGRLLIHYLEDVMELAKLENQTIQFSITETDLPQLFNEIHREYLNEIHQKGNMPELFLKIAPTSEINTCYTDKGRLYQVMKHLLDVALILTEKGYIQLGYEAKDTRQIIFFVKYTGKRLTPEQQKILTDPFRIRENVADPIIQKIGLKLALVKLITRCLDGKFYIETGDQVDIFSIALPYKRKEPFAPTNDYDITQKPNWKNKVILIAEDDDINFQFLEALLSETHAQIIHVQNGKEAVEICQSLPKIDLILMDIKMPEKNGYEAIKEIRQLKGKEITIIAQTAYSSKKEKDECFRVGCDAYLVKPIDVAIFFKTLSKFLNE